MEDKQIGFCEWLPGEMIVNFEKPIHLKCRCEHFSTVIITSLSNINLQ